MTARDLVRVELGGRAYTIEIGRGNLAGVASLVASLRRTAHAVVITDQNVEHPHGAAVAASLADGGVEVDLLAIEPGEASKSVEMADSLWNKLLDLGTGRHSIVLAVGGGVVGDLAGFVAATFARGLPLVQVPTTLLAQVDSAIGGKVGVNLPGAKNMVGAFWQPLGVLADTSVLTTLPPREFRSGLAEVVKYAVILDPRLFATLEEQAQALVARDHEQLRRVIARCCRLKADVVADDEREETGQRAVLNYGHTFGHAFESLTGYTALLHGEAVAIGMQCAARLAERLGRVDASFTSRQGALLAALGLPVEPPALDADSVIEAMGRDKKSAQRRMRLVLPTRLGNVELVDNVPLDQVRSAIAG